MEHIKTHDMKEHVVQVHGSNLNISDDNTICCMFQIVRLRLVSSINGTSEQQKLLP